MAQIKFIRGTREQYNNLLKGSKATEVKNSVYFVTDDQVIMMNEQQYGGATGTLFDGFVKNLDVEGQTLTFHKDVKGVDTEISIELIKAVDNSIVIGNIVNGKVTDGSTIKVNVKAVGDNDGLKLGDDGLYVDLTKTNSAITANDTAITKLNADAATVGSVDNKIDTAIKGLDVNSIGEEGKFVKSVSETDGKIAAELGDLVSTAVTRAATTNVTGQVDMTGTTVEGALVDLAKAVSETKKGAATYKINKVTEGLATNVKEAYQLVQTVNGVDSPIEVQIPIYKDQTLKSVELTDTDGKKTGQYLKYTYTTANGTDDVVYVDVSKFLVDSEFKNGLSVSESGEVSVKIDATSEEFLTVGTGGVKLSGVTDAINTVKDTIIGDAAEEYNTLGKLEDKIQAVDAKASSAHTEVVVKEDGHVTVAVADSTDGTHKVVTISEDDIASAKELENVKNSLGKISLTTTAVTRTATTGVDGQVDMAGTTAEAALVNLAKAVKTEETRALAAEGQNATNITTNANAITVLNGDDTVEGSVAKAKKDAIAEANTYTDNSLKWIEAGDY